MMGERRIRQEALFYEFSLERHVPEKHLLRLIDRFVELDGLRQATVSTPGRHRTRRHRRSWGWTGCFPTRLAFEG